MRPSALIAVVSAQALAGLILVAPASAEISPDKWRRLVEDDARFCRTRMVNEPGPDGESDIKASPKLGAYCACLGELHAQRILRYDTGPVRTEWQEESATAERDRRDFCRAKTGLPPVPDRR